jgi:hypothetical protein
MNSSSYSLTVRSPAGTDFWQSDKLPRRNAILSHCGQRYRVASCEPVDGHHYVVTLVEPETEHVEPAIV